MRCGGGGGIRTLETVARLHAFQACAFNHSATPPLAGATILIADACASHLRAGGAIEVHGPGALFPWPLSERDAHQVDQWVICFS